MNPPALRTVRSLLVRGLSLLALLALALASPEARGAAALGAMGLAAGWARAPRPHSALAWNVALALLALGVAIVVPMGVLHWRWAGLGLVLALMAHRARVGRGPADDRVALLLALLAMLMASADGRSLALAPVLVLIVVATPGALLVLGLQELVDAGATLAEPLAARRRWLALPGLGLATLALTGVFFFTLPRLDARALAALGEATGSTGYRADDVELGEIGVSKLDPTPVLTARVTDASGRVLRGPFYFRGGALDAFDGRRWTVSEATQAVGRQPVRPRVDPLAPAPGQLRQELVLEPIEGLPLFGIPKVEALFLDESVTRDLLGGLRVEAPTRARRVVVHSLLAEDAGTSRLLRRMSPPGALTQLPADLDPRVAELVQATVGDARGAEEKARRIVELLQNDYDYTLVPPPEIAGQGLSGFLFGSKAGHCEYFATALAVMLRQSGVPAVLALGFYGGEWNELGQHLTVRQSHAHAWVEAELAPGRWVRLDATPSGEFAGEAGGLASQLGDVARAWWRTWVIDYDLDRQLFAARAAGELLFPSGDGGGAPPGALLLLPLLALVVAAGRARRWAAGERARAAGRVTALHTRARALVARRGWAPPPWMPPVAAAQWLVDEIGEPARPLLDLAWLHYEVTYGSTPEAQALPRARACLSALRALPRRSRT